MAVPTAAKPSGSTTNASQNSSDQNSPNQGQSTPNQPGQNAPSTPPPQPVLTGYRFIGGGFGHGVGMSQTGAYNLGEQGYSSKQILEFYYPGTELEPLSESITFYKDD